MPPRKRGRVVDDEELATVDTATEQPQPDPVPGPDGEFKLTCGILMLCCHGVIVCFFPDELTCQAKKTSDDKAQAGKVLPKGSAIAAATPSSSTEKPKVVNKIKTGAARAKPQSEQCV